MNGNRIANVPSLMDAARFTDPVTGGKDVIVGSLYDYQVYPTAGSTEMLFFQNPVGAGKTSSSGYTAGLPKTIADTNMRGNGMLGAGYAFLAQSIEVDFIPGSVNTADTFTLQNPMEFNAAAATTVDGGIADKNAIYSTGHLSFNVSSKVIAEDAPLMMFPPMNRLEVNGAISSNSATVGALVGLSLTAAGQAYILRVPRTLMPNEQFNVALKWPAAVATPSGFNGRIGVRFRGLWYRPVQ